MAKWYSPVLILLVAASSPAAAEIDAARFAGLVSQGQSQWRVPGVAVSLVENGEVVLQRGFGRTTIGGEAIDEHTLFANASTTKAMVVAGLLILADEKHLTLDDPLIAHLPEVQFHESIRTDAITLRDLLSHRTGLPRTDFWTFQQRMPLAEQIKRLQRVAPVAGPRERLLYQNTMYELAGLVIERVSGEPWYDFLEARLWRPIGMHETYGMRAQIPDSKSHVLPHAVIGDGVQRIPYDLAADEADAAGSAWSSLHDMTLWAQFLLDDGVTAGGARLISAAGMKEMFEPHQISSEEDFYPTVELTEPNWRSYGLGWFQQDFQGRKIEFHTGSLDGLVAIIGLDRANDSAVVVLQNMGGSELRHALLWEAFDRASAGARRDWLNDVFNLYAARRTEAEKEWANVAAGRIKNTRPALPLENYFGVYTNDTLGDIIFAEGSAGNDSDVAIPARPAHNGPVLRTKMYEYEATHWHLDTFLLEYISWDHGIFAGFGVGPDGKVATLTIDEDVFRKVD